MKIIIIINKKLKELIFNEIKEISKKEKLQTFEIPIDFLITNEKFSINNKLLTIIKN